MTNLAMKPIGILLGAALFFAGGYVGFRLGVEHAARYEIRTEGNAVFILDRKTGKVEAHTARELHDRTVR